MNDDALPPSPSGWFAIATADELPPGKVLPRRLCGHDLVVFRTASGAARVLDAHCPHLGAHLGHGGRVEGEGVRCPFHGFCFDGAGACTATGYGTRPPPRARLRAWPVHETGGVVLVWHDQSGAPPAWRVLEVDWDRFTRPTFHRFSLAAHPQQTTENSVDIGHFAWVHGFRSVESLAPLTLHGPYLHARYAVQHPLWPLGRPRAAARLSFRNEFTVHVCGLGYSRVELTLPSLGIRSRHMVLSTPTEPGRVDLRIGIAVDKERPLGLPGRLGAAAARLLQGPMMAGYRLDVSQDFHIWQHQRTSGPVALAEGDGPIGRYRRWARQFYGATALGLDLDPAA